MRERRRSTRRCPVAGEALSWARLRTGTELAVIDISDHGALVESRIRLLPGTHVDLHLLTTGGRVLQRARIARAFVGRVDASTVCYLVALAFDVPVDTSPSRVITSHHTRPPGEAATQERDPARFIAATLPPSGQFRTDQLAPVLETGPAQRVTWKETLDVHDRSQG